MEPPHRAHFLAQKMSSECGMGQDEEESPATWAGRSERTNAEMRTSELESGPGRRRRAVGTRNGRKSGGRSVGRSVDRGRKVCPPTTRWLPPPSRGRRGAARVCSTPARSLARSFSARSIAAPHPLPPLLPRGRRRPNLSFGPPTPPARSPLGRAQWARKVPKRRKMKARQADREPSRGLYPTIAYAILRGSGPCRDRSRGAPERTTWYSIALPASGSPALTLGSALGRERRRPPHRE